MRSTLKMTMICDLKRTQKKITKINNTNNITILGIPKQGTEIGTRNLTHSDKVRGQVSRKS